jgi:hypothetical protein
VGPDRVVLVRPVEYDEDDEAAGLALKPLEERELDIVAETKSCSDDLID